MSKSLKEYFKSGAVFLKDQQETTMSKSLKELIEAGIQMTNHGWTVRFSSEELVAQGSSMYMWTSPRGKVYYSQSNNVPTAEAVEDALSHQDICTSAKS